MEISIEQISLFLVFVLPGLISLKVFSLIVPTKTRGVSEFLFDGLFYTSLNLIFLIPIYFYLLRFEESLDYWVFVIFYFSMLLLSIGFPFFVYWLYSKESFTKRFLLPFPTSWDYFFIKRESCFIIFHLKDGEKIGGYYGEKSYSCSYPDEGSIYIEAVFKVNKDGTLGDKIEGTKGLLITKDQYDFIEMFEIPIGENK